MAKTTLVQNIRKHSDERDIPWRKNPFPETIIPKEVIIESVTGLKFKQSLVKVKAGQPLIIKFSNRDNTMSHNIVFVKPGTMQQVVFLS